MAAAPPPRRLNQLLPRRFFPLLASLFVTLFLHLIGRNAPHGVRIGGSFAGTTPSRAAWHGERIHGFGPQRMSRGLEQRAKPENGAYGEAKTLRKPVKGTGAAFNPGDPWTIPDFGPSRRTFKCLEYDEAYEADDGKEVISVDGLVPGSSLHISHWSDNKTPQQLYSDLSTEIALRFIKTSASREERWDTAVVINNHFDTDGVCSAFTLLKPDIAWKHRRILVDAAAVGDFDEWPRMDMNALKLHGAIEAIAESGETNSEKYDLVIPRMESLLKNIDEYESLWGNYMQEINRGMRNLKALNEQQYSVFNDNAIGVVIMPVGMPEIPKVVLSSIFRFDTDRFLIVRSQERETDKYTYNYSMKGHAWAPVTQRPRLKKPYIERMQLKMKEATGVEWKTTEGLTGLLESDGVIDMDPELVIEELVNCDSTLRTLAKLSQMYKQIRNPLSSETKDVLSDELLKKNKKKLRY